MKILTSFLALFLFDIIGGLNADSSYLYHVSIEIAGKHACSGAIVNHGFILTTASCIYNISAADVLVRVGSHQFDDGGTLEKIYSLILHKKYMPSRKDYDIGVVILLNSLEFTDTIQPIKLPKRDLNPPKEGFAGTLIGFGLGETDYSSDLRHQDIVVSAPSVCKNAYAPLFIYITERMFCAKLKPLHPCYGDYGSLFVVDNILYGISSWEHKCGTPKFPGIYSNVPSLIAWIQKQMTT